LIGLEIFRERDAQDQQWGVQDHDPFTWLSILGEEVGEAHKAALEARFGTECLYNDPEYDPNTGGECKHCAGKFAELRTELVQVAAVAMAAIEGLDRGAWDWGASRFSPAPSRFQPAPVRTCRVCGCTDADCSGCVDRTGAPCHWVAPDLCSACVAEADDLQRQHDEQEVPR